MKSAPLLLLFCMALPAAAELDPQTGLVIAPGYEVVKVQCTVCHSARLITQGRADREGWLSKIRWMQDTQGLWPLGPNEPLILDYLAANYAPEDRGRRPQLAPYLMPE